MFRSQVWRWVVLTVTVLVIAAVVRNQVRVYVRGVARSEEMRQRHPPPTLPPEVAEDRRALFDALRPVTIRNCALERFGGRGDGSYLMCGNLLDEVQTGYSYGIGGHDRWGCDISDQTEVAVHQYDCFNLERPWCWRGETVFHEACVGGTTETIDGRRFDTVDHQVAANGDRGKRMALKIDVEGAEWDTILAMPDDLLGHVEQLAVEFHWREDPVLGWAHDRRYLAAVGRLRQFFEVGHIHFNNKACVGDLAPFPAYAFEVLFVSKRLAVVDASTPPVRPNPLDSRTSWWLPDCQIQSGL